MQQTLGSPDPPALGTTESFTIAGISTHPLTIDKLEFKCWLFGAPVYDEKFAPTTAMAMPGTVWTDTIPFDVPGVAPSTEYDIQVCAIDASAVELFCMRTAFK